MPGAAMSKRGFELEVAREKAIGAKTARADPKRK
jgi:hypothetical protein